MPRTREALRLTDRYHDMLVRLADRAGVMSGRRFAQVDSEDLGESYRRAIRDCVGIITLSQGQAAALARTYWRNLARLETGEAEQDEPLEENAGFTSDGRRLGEGLAASRAKVLLALKMGRPLSQAVGFGAFGAQRFGFTEVMDAADLELLHQMEGKAIGWRLRSRGTCAGCISLDNGSVRSGEGPPFHPNCACMREPVLVSKERYFPETGRERYSKLPIEEKEALIGKEAAALLERGEIGWDDLVSTHPSKKWQPVTTAATLEEATS